MIIDLPGEFSPRNLVWVVIKWILGRWHKIYRSSKRNSRAESSRCDQDMLSNSGIVSFVVVVLIVLFSQFCKLDVAEGLVGADGLVPWFIDGYFSISRMEVGSN